MIVKLSLYGNGLRGNIQNVGVGFHAIHKYVGMRPHFYGEIYFQVKNILGIRIDPCRVHYESIEHNYAKGILKIVVEMKMDFLWDFVGCAIVDSKSSKSRIC